MHEMNRLQELFQYQVLDTEPEQVLDDLAEIAALVCDTPASLITMVDEARTWHKTMYGFSDKQVRREDSFCQHLLEHPHELLIVEDALADAKFAHNPYVQRENGIRFYAGAPLVTPKGNVLGSLCVVDTQPRSLSLRQQQALKILSRKAMDYLTARKLLLLQNQSIVQHSHKVKRFTDLAPGVLFQFRHTAAGTSHFDFVSEGFTLLFPHLRVEHLYADPNALLAYIHRDDVPNVKKSLDLAFKQKSNWHFLYRSFDLSQREIWHMVKARVETATDQETLWYGSIQDISGLIQHDKTLSELLFELSHNLRHPVANILGITQQIQEESLPLPEIMEYVRLIAQSAQELDLYIRQQNSYFNQQKKT